MTFDKIISGIGAQNGIVVGVARVINSSNLDVEFNEGDILVTKFTSPLLIPFIKKAGAIVCDLGGSLCHAAIIAREFGIPCIVGSKNATKIIKSGQKILVNATTGGIYGI